jgi:hypothetical protein
VSGYPMTDYRHSKTKTGSMFGNAHDTPRLQAVDHTTSGPNVWAGLQSLQIHGKSQDRSEIFREHPRAGPHDDAHST